MSLLTLFPSWHRFCSVEVGACDDSVLSDQGPRHCEADGLRGEVKGVGVHADLMRQRGTDFHTESRSTFPAGDRA